MEEIKSALRSTSGAQGGQLRGTLLTVNFLLVNVLYRAVVGVVGRLRRVKRVIQVAVGWNEVVKETNTRTLALLDGRLAPP